MLNLLARAFRAADTSLVSAAADTAAHDVVPKVNVEVNEKDELSLDKKALACLRSVQLLAMPAECGAHNRDKHVEDDDLGEEG